MAIKPSTTSSISPTTPRQPDPSTGWIGTLGQHTYSGGTFLKAGTLLVAPSALGSGAVTLQNAALGSAGGTVNVSSLLTGGTLVVNSPGSVLEISNASNNFTGPIVV